MQVLLNNEINREDWSDLFSNCEFASPFQSFEYYTFIQSVNQSKAIAVAVKDQESLVALCVIEIRKQSGLAAYFSRRALVYGGPMIRSYAGSAQALGILIDAINKHIHSLAIYVETYNFFDYSNYKDVFQNKQWTYEPHLNIQINIKGKTTAEVLSLMKYDRRRAINASLKEGCVLREAETKDDIKSLYNLLVDLYNERVKLPLPPYKFFAQLFENKYSKVLIVEHNETIIGGAFCVYIPNGTIYTIYHCGIRNYQKNIFPAHLAVFAAMEFGIKNNLTLVDLMGAGRPDKEYGVRESKLRFGGELIELGRFMKKYNPFLFSVGKAGLQFIKFVKR